MSVRPLPVVMAVAVTVAVRVFFPRGAGGFFFVFDFLGRAFGRGRRDFRFDLFVFLFLLAFDPGGALAAAARRLSPGRPGLGARRRFPIAGSAFTAFSRRSTLGPSALLG